MVKPVSKERRGHQRTSLCEPFFEKKELTFFPGCSEICRCWRCDDDCPDAVARAPRTGHHAGLLLSSGLGLPSGSRRCWPGRWSRRPVTLASALLSLSSTVVASSTLLQKGFHPLAAGLAANTRVLTQHVRNVDGSSHLYFVFRQTENHITVICLSCTLGISCRHVPEYFLHFSCHKLELSLPFSPQQWPLLCLCYSVIFSALLHDKKWPCRKAAVWLSIALNKPGEVEPFTTARGRLGLGTQLTHATFCASLQNVTLSKLVPAAPERSPLEQRLFLQSPKQRRQLSVRGHISTGLCWQSPCPRWYWEGIFLLGGSTPAAGPWQSNRALGCPPAWQPWHRNSTRVQESPATKLIFV